MIGYYLVKCAEDKSKGVTDSLQVIKLYEDERFGDTYYDINYRRNVNLQKPRVKSKQVDVSLLLDYVY